MMQSVDKATIIDRQVFYQNFSSESRGQAK